MKRIAVLFALVVALWLVPVSLAAQGEGPAGRLVFQQATGGALYTVNLDGSQLKKVGAGLDPAWSPDGSRIVYAQWEPPRGLYVMNADGSNKQRIYDQNEIKSPRWSPDGQSIVFSRRDEYVPRHQRCIGDFCWIVETYDGWTLEKLTLRNGSYSALSDLPTEWKVHAPVWTPDGDRILYGSSYGIQEVDAEGEWGFDYTMPRKHAVTFNYQDTDPAISPDGRYLLTTFRQHDHWEIHRIDLQTGERRRLTKSSILAPRDANNASPVWSPDGKQIFFISDRNGAWEFFLMNPDGSNQRPILQEVTRQVPLRYDGYGEQVVDWAP